MHGPSHTTLSQSLPSGDIPLEGIRMYVNIRLQNVFPYGFANIGDVRLLKGDAQLIGHNFDLKDRNKRNSPRFLYQTKTDTEESEIQHR